LRVAALLAGAAGGSARGPARVGTFLALLGHRGDLGGLGARIRWPQLPHLSPNSLALKLYRLRRFEKKYKNAYISAISANLKEEKVYMSR
jgi:hypothetical protein